MATYQTGPNIGSNARVTTTVPIGPDTAVEGNAMVALHSVLSGQAQVAGHARMGGYARMQDHASLSGNAQAIGYCMLKDFATVYGNAIVTGNAVVSGYSEISGFTRITGNAVVMGGTFAGSAHISDGARVFETSHAITLTGLFDEPVTVYRTKDGHAVTAGCQLFTLDEDLELLARDHEWPLPAGWKAIRNGLKAVADTWH